MVWHVDRSTAFKGALLLFFLLTFNSSFASINIILETPVAPPITPTLQSVTEAGNTTTEPLTLHNNFAQKPLANDFFNGSGTISFVDLGHGLLRVDGTGTLFTQEIVIGDIIAVHAQPEIRNGIVVSITSDTMLHLVFASAIDIGSNLPYYIYPAQFRLSDTTNKSILSVSQNLIRNPLTGATAKTGTILQSPTFIQNDNTLHSGVVIETLAGDGRMRIRGTHNVVSSIDIWQSGSPIVLNGVVTNNLFAGGETRLSATGSSGGQVNLKILRSGSTANATVFMTTERYAMNTDFPRLSIASNGMYFGLNTGSNWLNNVENYSLYMNPNLNWRFGTFGNTLPNEQPTHKVEIFDTNNQFAIGTNASNYMSITQTETGQSILENTGTNGSIIFASPIDSDIIYYDLLIAKSPPILCDKDELLCVGFDLLNEKMHYFSITENYDLIDVQNQPTFIRTKFEEITEKKRIAHLRLECEKQPHHYFKNNTCFLDTQKLCESQTGHRYENKTCLYDPIIDCEKTSYKFWDTRTESCRTNVQKQCDSYGNIWNEKEESCHIKATCSEFQTYIQETNSCQNLPQESVLEMQKQKEKLLCSTERHKMWTERGCVDA